MRTRAIEWGKNAWYGTVWFSPRSWGVGAHLTISPEGFSSEVQAGPFGMIVERHA